MNGYKLGKLSINNFKLLDTFENRFDDNDIVILDGPNGYGKTTLFDSLELLITGQISRVNDNDVANSTFKYRDVFLAKDSTKPIVIKGEFIRGDNRIIIARKKEGITGTKKENKATNWEQYRVYKLEEFDDEISANKKISQNDLNQYFGLEDKNIKLMEDFRYFYYIQQENNTQFLKGKEADRVLLLSKFFGTSEAEALKERINEKLEILSNEKDRLDQEVIKINKELASITLTKNQGEEAKFVSILTNQEWDKKEFIPTEKNFTNILTQLEKIKQFKLNLDNFKIYLKNEEYKKLTNAYENRLIGIRQYIVCSHFEPNFKKIEEKFDQYNEYGKYKQLLLKDKFDSDNFNFKLLKKLLNTTSKEEQYTDIENIITSINRYKKASSDFSSLLSSLINTREDLINKFEKFKEDENSWNTSHCPLCGKDWESYKNLIEKIDKTTEEYKRHIDTNANNVLTLTNELYKKYLNIILKQISEYLDNPKNVINEKFFEQLKTFYNKEEILFYRKKLQELGIYEKIEKLVNRAEQYVEDLETKIHTFNSIVEEKIVSIKEEDFYEYLDDMIGIYNSVYEKDLEKITQITGEEIRTKVQYISQKYYYKQEEKKKQFDVELVKEQKNLKIIKRVIKKSKLLSQKLESDIKKQWKKTIKQVEIPLFIYSGKILQNTQRGNGIFMSYDDSKKRGPLKFVASLDTDHDVIYSMSSGQLSGLMIALTLALNKVYGGDRGGLLLVDDPVQSMDEINMASFIELMRNEFNQTQLMMSTHEDAIANYMHYKFKKYGKNVRRFHVKSEFK